MSNAVMNDVQPMGALQRFQEFVRTTLPQGRPLPPEMWQRRHQWIVLLVWLHAVGLGILGFLGGYGVRTVLGEISAIALCAGIASIPSLPRRVRAAFASLGLITSSAVLIHFGGGAIEMHFHFFVVIPILALYQDWIVFLLTLGYVVLHHGTIGIFASQAVYNHPDAVAHPIKWAIIHAVFVLGASAASMVNWRLNELALQQAEARAAAEQLTLADMQRLQETHDLATQLQQREQETHQRLAQAVGEYLEFTHQVAQGNLQQRVDTRYDGAIGQLGQGLNDMASSLQNITSQVQQTSTAIASAAAEILASTNQQAASAAEQSAAITETTTTVEEVKAIAQQTTQQANRLVQDSQDLLQVAHQGTQSVEQTVDGMGLIRERVDSIAHTILALSEQTAAIGEITTTVTDLADQSNLLALNAAIEAARAGEQGKGFAVVAQHVRELSERSKQATAQVREILTEIQRATSTAVMVTEEGTKGVTQGAELAGRAGQVIARMSREVENGAQANVQVAAAAQQQTAGMEQIGQAMGAIQQATTETLSSTRQAERAAKDLASLAQSLQQAVAAYKV